MGLPARGKSYLSNRLMRYLRVSSICSRGGSVLKSGGNGEDQKVEGKELGLVENC